jgi:hypothetical protein
MVVGKSESARLDSRLFVFGRLKKKTKTITKNYLIYILYLLGKKPTPVEKPKPPAVAPKPAAKPASPKPGDRDTAAPNPLMTTSDIGSGNTVEVRYTVKLANSTYPWDIMALRTLLRYVSKTRK